MVEWIEEALLRLAVQKTEVVLLMKDGEEIYKILKGIHEQKFKLYTTRTSDGKKAEEAIEILNRILPNTRGVATPARKLLLAVSMSMMLYASEVWGL